MMRFDNIDVDNPPNLVPCCLCHGMCMGTEQVHDWHRRGLVIRISSLCEEALSFGDKDDARTDFAPESEAVTEWNQMNGEKKPEWEGT